MGRKNKNKKIIYECEICHNTDSEEPVVACDKWHHFDCVGITTIGKKDSWVCDKCKETKSFTNSHRDSHQSTKQPSVVSRQDSHQSTKQPTVVSHRDSHQSTKQPTVVSHRDSHQSTKQPTVVSHRDSHQSTKQSSVVSRQDSHQSTKQSLVVSNRNLNQSLASRSTRISSQRQRIELEIIEEERILREKRDAEYLEKKYRVLLQRVEQSDKREDTSYISEHPNYTKNWIEQQRFISPPATITEIDERERKSDCHLSQKLTFETNPTWQFSQEKQVDLQRCDFCHMVGDGIKFKKCLTCAKIGHIICLDIIWIDNETRWICKDCKKPEIHSIKTQPKKEENGSNQGSKDELLCTICDKKNNHKSFKPCDVCDKEFHFECMDITSIDKQILWVCKDCKGHNTHSKHVPIPPQQSMNQLNSTELQAIPAVSNFPSVGKILQSANMLTKSQIASRHVVTRDLPIFIGKPEEWPMFLSRFNNSTELCGFSNSENLDRLQKCLKGNALEAVRSRLLTAESVPEIMSTLEMLYGRPELIVNALMRKIRSQPSPNAEKLNTLVDFALSVKNVCATLEQAKLIHHLSNPALVQELVEKLPNNFKIEWAKYKGGLQDITLSTLATFLYDLAKVISTVTEPSPPKEYKPENKFKSDGKTSKKDSRIVYTHQNHNINKDSKDLNVDGKLEFKGKLGNDKNSSQCCICLKKCPKVATCPVFLSYDADQRWKEMYKNKLCRKCLDRHGRFCTQAKMCGVSGCIFKHHSLLHDEKRHSAEAIAKNQDDFISKNNNIHFSMLRSVLLRIVPVTLYHGDQHIQTFAYQDDGSDISMVEEHLAKSLGIKGYSAPLCLLWTADVHRREETSQCINVEISGQNEFTQRFWLKDARTVPSLGLPIQSIIRDYLVDKFPYLEEASFIDYQNAVPQILIGSDNAHLNVPLSIIEGTLYQPIACQTRIGWSINGCTNSQQPQEDIQISNYHRHKCPYQQIDEQTHRMMKEHFSVENFGVQANDNLMFCSKEDERALCLLKKYTKRIDDRYETALLWRYDDISMPDSYNMALKRLQCLEKHKPTTIPVINQTIEDHIRKGYVRKLSEAEIQRSDQRVWYLPLFTVFHPKKPEKIRVVFDGAAKVHGVSLNSLLLTGPDQLPSLVDILRRFREKKVAAVGDISEMFHQIKIRQEDVQSQRFLWRNGDTTKNPDQYVIQVMTFGANCSPTSAQFVKNQNATEFEKQYPRAVESIVKNHYVDDMLDCQDSEQEMIQLINEVKKVHKHGGFDIRNFISNSSAVRKECNDNRTELQDENCIDISYGLERVLGMWWNTAKDCLTFSLKYTKIDPEIANGNRMPTKRELLRILMSIFDPLGLISHYLIHLKIILQDVWRSTFDWDEKITSIEIQSAWNKWFALLSNVEKVEIPRLYSTKMSPSTPTSIELHIFVDASEKAFSALAYLRVEDNDGVDCILIGSKARVTPLKYLSIPRQELQAGILGTRLLKSIENAQTFKIDETRIWTDSHTLLSWINSDSRKYHQFVAHRIGEILESTNAQIWRWIPTKQNVADEATKWTKPPTFDNTNRWFSGPGFLRLPKSEWPKNHKFESDTQEEMKIQFAHSSLVIPTLINPNHISKWNTIHRAIAYVRRYVLILKAKIRKEIIPIGPLTREELIVAENLLFRQAQFQDFTEEMVLLLRDQQLSKHQQKYVQRSSPLYKLSPYLDENGLIRHHGRIDSTNDVSFSMKRPIILPRGNRITQLLVANYHRSYHHRNHRTVYNAIRQRFYIPCLRVVLNSIRNTCQRCKNKRAKPQPPEMADLPPARLAIGFKAFTYIGIDYFGPMYITIGRRNEKRWGVLITCLTVRAVHIELAYKLDTESCIMCIRNFANLRGAPQEIYSDQGSNMKGMDNELKKLVQGIDVVKMASDLTTCYTKWCFNPPHSPHMGGAWERMVGSVKTCLYDIMPTRHPTEDMLRNLLLEVSNIVNSRPLTYVPLEHDDDDILTPNHFIIGIPNNLQPMIEIDCDGPILRSKWMENQRLADKFWIKFVKEFLPELTRRTKWFERVEPIKVDDIVLLVDETNIRGQYPKCRVIETYTGSNDQVRRAKILRINNEGSRLQRSILVRPVVSLAKLDVHIPEVSLSVTPVDRQTEGSVMNDGNTAAVMTPLDEAN